MEGIGAAVEFRGAVARRDVDRSQGAVAATSDHSRSAPPAPSGTGPQTSGLEGDAKRRLLIARHVREERELAVDEEEGVASGATSRSDVQARTFARLEVGAHLANEAGDDLGELGFTATRPGPTFGPLLEADQAVVDAEHTYHLAVARPDSGSTCRA